MIVIKVWRSGKTVEITVPEDSFLAANHPDAEWREDEVDENLFEEEIED